MNRRSSPSSQKCLRFLVATYRWLLRLYPAPFRRAFGAHMEQVFRDSCHRAEREHGFPGLIALWLPTLLDLLRSAFAEHLEAGTILSRPFFIRVSGLLIMVGATVDVLLYVDEGASAVVAGYRGVPQYLAQVSHGEAMLIGLFYTPVVCSMLGLAGLLLAQRGWSGRLCVSLGCLALGGYVTVHLLSALQIPGVERVLENAIDWMGEQGWGFSQTDGLLLGMALMGSGVVTLRAQLFSHWNAVVLLLGLGQVSSILMESYWLDASPTIGSGSARIMVVPYLSALFCACLWGVLGYLLWANHRTTQAVPAVQPQPRSR